MTKKKKEMRKQGKRKEEVLLQIITGETSSFERGGAVQIEGSVRIKAASGITK